MEADKSLDNLSNKPVGIVVKTASPLSFDVLLDESSFVQLDDVLVCKSVVKRYNESMEVKFYGVVIELIKYLEGVDILYQEIKAKEGVLPVHPVYLAKINVNRIEPQYYLPQNPVMRFLKLLVKIETKVYFLILWRQKFQRDCPKTVCLCI